jgi:DNA phosphorothioation-dependent restriction protein DptG
MEHIDYQEVGKRFICCLLNELRRLKSKADDLMSSLSELDFLSVPVIIYGEKSKVDMLFRHFDNLSDLSCNLVAELEFVIDALEKLIQPDKSEEEAKKHG